MSKVKTDTSLWLHNKLGNVNDLWSSGSICSQLNSERLTNIRDCFTDLQPLVKLKLLISFLHIPRRNVDEWKNELKDIIEVAIPDSDQWVSMVGELLKTYPQKGTINFDIQENSSVFNDLINELRKLVKKHNDQSILPIECLYLNKNALNSIIGNIPPPTKHFNLKNNPKSFALRSDLLQKSHDAALNLKKGGNPGLPIRNRSGSKDLNDQTPLKGIPRSLNTSQFKMPTIQNRLQIGAGRNPTRPSMPGVRKDVGIKFLEQPVSLPDAKKKKKVDKEQTEPTTKSKDNDKSNVEQTPNHYAAGLADYVPPSPALHSSTYNDSSNQQIDKPSNDNYHHDPPQQQQMNPVFQTNLTSSGQQLPPMPYTQQLDSSSINKPIDQIHIQPPIMNQPNMIQTNSIQQQPLQNQQPQQQTVRNVRNVTTLTKQQADELRMLSREYPVGKNELSSILSFMSGNRQNPESGDVQKVKLGEKREIVRQQDGAFLEIISDSYYHMNYRTGEAFQVTDNRRINPNVNIQELQNRLHQ